MTTTPTLEISERPAERRFEAHANGELVGFVDYIPLPGKIIATHTEVFDQFESMGYASQLVRGMIEQLRADGRLLQPLCPYISAWLDRHPDQADIVDPSTPS